MKIILLPVVLLMTVTCGQSHGQSAPAGNVVGSSEPSRKPSVKDLLEATAPDYRSPVTVKQECLGRLVFDLESRIQWPTNYDADYASPFHRSFSSKVADPGDVIKFGNARIGVIGPINPELEKQVFRLTPFVYIDDLKGRIKDGLVRVLLPRLAMQRSQGRTTFALA